jgi:hypothetical protein
MSMAAICPASSWVTSAGTWALCPSIVVETRRPQLLSMKPKVASARRP